MTGRKKTVIALISLGVLAILLIVIFLVLNGDSADEESKANNKSSTSSSQPNTSTTSASSESTTTRLNLEDVSISLSTPFEGQTFENSQVSVRAIIEGATSGTCNLELTKDNASSIKVQAPIISAPTYFTCEGFDIEPSQFSEKGVWNLELEVKATDGKTGSISRKITVS